MTAQEAVDFGIVDGILDDDETVAQTKAIQNVYASYNGIERHYCLPQLPKFDQPDVKVPTGIMARLKNFFNDFRGVIEEDSDDLQIDNNNSNPIKAMKKIVLNLICAVLAIQDIAIGESGEATLNETQLNALEGALKEKDDRISALETEMQKAVTEKQAAETAKADIEQQLEDLRKEYDDFKAEAGDDTMRKPNFNADGKSLTSAEMFNDVKGLL